MKRHHGLFANITTFRNLLSATDKAALGKRDKPAVAKFLYYLEPELFRLEDELNAGTYQPGDYFVFDIRDPKPRRICAAPFRDRVVHHAVCNVLEPIFEKRLIFDSYACRTGKGTHAAIQRAQHFARRYPYFLKCDIRKYFESIDHAVMKALLRRMLKDRAVLKLLDTVIDHAPPYTEPGKGLPIGNLTSQHFANLYLGELDHFLKERLRIKGYIRYMDDLLLFGHDKIALHLAFADLREFVQDRLQLQIKDKSVMLSPVSEGIPFLGFRVFPRLVRLNQKTLRRFRRKFRGNEKAYLSGHMDMEHLSTATGALFAHISQADTLHLRRKLIERSLIPG